MFPWMEHPTAGRHRVTGPAIKMSETPGRPTTTAPLLGEHTAAALAELLGLGSQEIQRLTAEGVLAGPSS
jgi:formyl-CoA transferase